MKDDVKDRDEECVPDDDDDDKYSETDELKKVTDKRPGPIMQEEPSIANTAVSSGISRESGRADPESLIIKAATTATTNSEK